MPWPEDVQPAEMTQKELVIPSSRLTQDSTTPGQVKSRAKSENLCVAHKYRALSKKMQEAREEVANLISGVRSRGKLVRFDCQVVVGSVP